MSQNVVLGDEGMEEVRASEVFQDLEPGLAAELEEFLYTAFSGANGMTAAEAVSRLDRNLSRILPDPDPVRRVLLDVLGVS